MAKILEFKKRTTKVTTDDRAMNLHMAAIILANAEVALSQLNHRSAPEIIGAIEALCFNIEYLSEVKTSGGSNDQAG